MKKGEITAAELMAQLERDLEYLARRAAKDAEIEKLAAECKADEAELVYELNEIGVPIDSVWDLVNNKPHSVLERRFTGAYDAAYPILVKHLTAKHHDRVREGIIRSLTEKAAYSIAAEPLLAQLSTETKKHLRWVIANALESMLSSAEIKQHPQIKEALRAGHL